ncbi:MAG: hypothetical protein U5K37_08970 [Natrialbaceae archaeon]|nr:hypothetical protein [Natrialbaceae archaeon]
MSRSPIVVTGEFTGEEIRNGIQAEDFELEEHGEGSYGEFERLVATNGDLVVATREGEAVAGSEGTVVPVIDAGTGEGERLVDEDDNTGQLIDELGSGEIIMGDVRLDQNADTPFQNGLLASGNRLAVGEETTEFRVVDSRAGNPDQRRPSRSRGSS